MKKYFRRIYLNQPQKITTIIVFLILIIICLLPLFVNINSISAIKPLFDQFGTIITWVTTILVAVLPPLLKFILSKVSISRLKHASASPLSEPRNEDFAGIITKTDLVQKLSVKELLIGNSVRVGNQEYRFTNDILLIRLFCTSG